MTHPPREALAAPTRTVARHHPDDARVQWHAELTEICRAEIGMNEAFASLHAAAILRGLSARYGGAEVYIPAEDKTERNAAIRAEFDGRNADTLMRKYNISRTTLYRIAGER
jgi:Mor family transcriptional regulator